MTRRLRVESLVVIAVLGAAFGLPGPIQAEPYEQRDWKERARYTAEAGAANLVPGASALVAPRCLPGYIACKASFAIASVIGAAEQLLMSGGSDLNQTKAVLYRGWAGDWYVTPRQIADGVQPQVLPDPPPPASAPVQGSAPAPDPRP